MSRKNVNYPIEIKLQAIKMHLEEGTSYYRIAKILDLKCEKTAKLWVKRYSELGEDVLKERRGCSKSILKGRPKKKKEKL